MTMFWWGFATAVARYFAVGWVIGVIIVVRHLPYFFAGGWQYKRMLQTVGINTLAWPMAALDWLIGA
jgi:hypothetical protein